MKIQKSKYKNLVISVLLVLLTLFVFWQVTQNQFLSIDDDKMLTNNPFIRKGLTLESIKWAFTADLTFDSFNAFYWSPLSFFSYMIDIHFFGFDPFWHHLTNLYIHVFNVLLLFFLLKKITGCAYKSMFVAAFFAIHPLQVESVSWVTSRKDVLSAFFGIASLYSYINFHFSRYKRWYFISLFAFVLSLLVKPMFFGLPLLLLIIEFWPMSIYENFISKGGKWFLFKIDKKFLKAFYLKIPYFFLCLIYLPVPFKGQPDTFTHNGAQFSITKIFVAFFVYIKRFVYPIDLTIYGGSLRQEIPLVVGILSIVVLFGVSLFLLRKKKHYPYLFLGWFWFLIAMLPMIGIEWTADRYMYAPIIGLIIAFVWMVERIFVKSKIRIFYAFCLGLILLLVCSIISFKQCKYWRDSLSLFNRVVELNPQNYWAYNSLGYYYATRGESEQAKKHFVKALEIKPDMLKTKNNLGALYFQLSDYENAERVFKEVLSVEPRYADANNNLGALMSRIGNEKEAYKYYKRALDLNPYRVDALNNMGKLLVRVKKFDEAERLFLSAIDIKNKNVEAHVNLANLYAFNGKFAEAEKSFQNMINIFPSDPKYVYDLFNLYLNFGDRHFTNKDYLKAKNLYIKAKAIFPDDEKVLERLRSFSDY